MNPNNCHHFFILVSFKLYNIIFFSQLFLYFVYIEFGFGCGDKVLQDSKSYCSLNCVGGIAEKEMESLEVILLSLKKSYKLKKLLRCLIN
jgi:hypothetical protein